MWIPNWLAAFQSLSFRNRPVSSRRRRQLQFPASAETLECRMCLSAISISSVSLQNDTGTPGDNSTTDPTLSGTVTSDGRLDFVNAEFDLDSDGIADDYTNADTDGSFNYDPSANIDFGQVTINVRASEFDPDTAEFLYSGWTAITFTYEAPPNDPPAIASLSLQNDTGTAGDNITADPTLAGTVTNDGSMDLVTVEFDFDGDGTADDYAYVDTEGNFSYDPSSNIDYGQITINVRAAEFDENTVDYLYSDWTAITFTYQAPPNDPPAIASLSLQNDTGTAGDNITADPTLAGTVTNDGSMDLVTVEFDFDGDGTADDYAYVDTEGNFSYDPSSNIDYGQITINVRAAEFDENTVDYLYSDWTAITFTYQAPPNDPPAIASLSLQNDTGTAGDNITADPTLAGTVTNDGSMDLVTVEFDFDGDGTADDYAYVDAEGNFTYDPSSNIDYGQVTIYVRAAEYDPNTGEFLYSDWTAITFNYVQPN